MDKITLPPPPPPPPGHSTSWKCCTSWNLAWLLFVFRQSFEIKFSIKFCNSDQILINAFKYPFTWNLKHLLMLKSWLLVTKYYLQLFDMIWSWNFYRRHEHKYPTSDHATKKISYVRLKQHHNGRSCPTWS